jgi:hypothetical protein
MLRNAGLRHALKNADAYAGEANSVVGGPILPHNREIDCDPIPDANVNVMRIDCAERKKIHKSAGGAYFLLLSQFQTSCAPVLHVNGCPMTMARTAILKYFLHRHFLSLLPFAPFFLLFTLRYRPPTYSIFSAPPQRLL